MMPHNLPGGGIPKFAKFVSNLQVRSFGSVLCVSMYQSLTQVKLCNAYWCVFGKNFDQKKMCDGLTVDVDGLTVEQRTTARMHKICVLSEGFTLGSMYCQFKILKDTANQFIVIGVTDESQPNMLTTSFYPGFRVDKGVSYHGNNGNIYFSATTTAFAETYTTGDTIGILMNCDFGTVSFFKNGVMVGTALGSDVFRIGAKYYPAVTLFEIDTKIEICTLEDTELRTCSELLRSVVPGMTRLCPNLRVMSGGIGENFNFDLCNMAAGLQIDNDGLTIEQTTAVDSYKVLFAGLAQNIKIGVTDGSQPGMTTTPFYPGLDLDKGVSYCSSGARCCSNATNASRFPAFTVDTVGVLMNCDAGTVTFFKNGTPVGAALGPDVFRAGATYYPAVSLNGLGQKVAISTFEVVSNP